MRWTYLKKENLDRLYIGESVRALINLRCGKMEIVNKYWIDEEERLRIFCGQNMDFMSHYVEKCDKTEDWCYGIR